MYMRLVSLFSRLSISLLVLVVVSGLLGACGGHSGGNSQNPDGRHDEGAGSTGQVSGRLAAASNMPTASLLRRMNSALLAPGLGTSQQALSVDDVTVDLLQGDASSPPSSWPVAKTATPDATGAFAFAGLPEGDYALKVNQPEFATVAYGVDSTEFHLKAGQSVSLVLPLITTVVHGMTDPWVRSRQGGPPIVTTALDPATGEVAVLSTLGLAFVDPSRATMDLVVSRNFFPGTAVLALAPTTRVAWILYPDRLVRIDRALFTNPDKSETVDLDDAATRLAVADKVQFAMLPPPAGHGGYSFHGGYYFSPDEKILYASTEETGVMVIDLEQMRIVRAIMGRVIGYNPVSNHLFFSNGQALGSSGTEVLVVDATTRLEVNVVEFDNVRGVAPVPHKADTVMVGSRLSTSDAQIPFIKVVDATGSVVVDARAKDYLGLNYDPPAGAPSFDLTGEYFMIGSSAFRLLGGGAFAPVPTGVAAGPAFGQRVQCNTARAVDPANLYEIWYGCLGSSPTVALISLDQSNVPVAVRPSASTADVLLDQTRGRAIFWDADKLVFVHYADPSAASQPELVDLSAAVAPLVAPGATCSSANPCAGTDVCVGATDTAYTGRCTPNPRLPYLPFCGGFAQATCDDGFTCTTENPTNPNSFGQCGGTPSRDFAAHGPSCAQGLPCPAGMACNAAHHCVPKPCIRDQDCAAYPGEICGSVENLGPVCLSPGALPDGALCLAPEECLHGACVALEGAWLMGAGVLSDLRFGPLGIMRCTTPCSRNADCTGGRECTFDSRNSAPTYLSPETVWKTHRAPLMPFCWPTAELPVDGCDGACTSEELCSVGYDAGSFKVGFAPSFPGQVGTTSCIAPSAMSTGPVCSWGCMFPCKRSGDCPFATECVGGACSLPFMGSPLCTSACGAEQSCAALDCGAGHGFCVTSDSCASDADCGGVVGSCLHKACLGPSRTCTTAGDCHAGEECVQWLSDTPECLPPFCGCTGASAAGMLCKSDTRTCIIPGACTNAACGGAVAPECTATPPVPSPLLCTCPNCDWNDDMCPGSGAVPLCPDEFTCTHIGELPSAPHLGRDCTCNSADCQSP
jgi:hypothetical protein